MNAQLERNETKAEPPDIGIEVLHEIGERIAAADPLHTVLKLVVEFVSSVVKCDSCFVYVIEENELILRASQNPHAEVVGRLKIRMGRGITGWVAEHKKPVAIAREAALDRRFQSFHELPEDRFEAFLSVPILCRDKLVGVINVQHREPHSHTQREIQLISTIGFLVGPEIELVRLEAESSRSSELSEALEIVERAKAVLSRDVRLSAEDAAAMLQRESRQRRKSMKEVSEAILLADEILGAQRNSKPAKRQV
ncbi:MAG TPA: GAF and ANTAR domain-containing protein [Candidatus Acidoferrales bacterium]|jgi:uroporphyrinogen-III synthase|nr:GAF and ANTAR domain-containing protein [Candidatus Acidoferrales bacterium]